MSLPLVYVVDDEQPMRESLRFLLETVRLQVKTYESAPKFLSEFDPELNAVLVTDLRMPGMSGIELHEHLYRNGHRIPVIIITAHGDVPTVVRAMKQGACEFLEKPFNDQILIDAIQRLLEQDRERRIKAEANRQVAQKLRSLTPRELQVLELVVEGRINKQIASELGVGVKAIEAHRARIMDKMQAESVQELVRMMTLLRQSPEYANPLRPSY
ncbi:two component transcriptional regulator, LuxR family [Isosphaera pallida ATCC 43644]|jgi:FixJ family two-component response regulator|uniref:Two component transcriptional regulator, LuxR family n=1 Tax=Isosphaera pallida (strain ATCC 43644 / DSM 9630 / IS1B) TaxID=575540 RepID=E8R4F7_ISOPI|nr:response regulator [Isosphaera pallida]ADV63752.1 two component transcriptional regulator, LuxR family [Isosphaera pallida ATCC 43644]